MGLATSPDTPRQPLLDVAGNRRARKYSHLELALRLVWHLARPLFRLSPRWAFAWRRLILRTFKAKIGQAVRIDPTVEVFAPWLLTIGDESAIGANARLYNLGPIALGSQVTISQGAHLCAGTHDYTDPQMPLLKPPIRVGDAAWICADAFIGPGVSVGVGAVVAARAVVVSNVGDWDVVAGNPARRIKKRALRH